VLRHGEHCTAHSPLVKHPSAHWTYVLGVEEGGVSQAQFIREASLIRALLVLKEGMPATGTAELQRWQALSDEVRRLSGS
jgi:hypothetical protein